MEYSGLLMSAKIHFIDVRISLIHIPLSKYQSWLPTILRLIFPSTAHSATSWANQHPFLNVTVTPTECSLMCPHDLAEALFATKTADGKGRGSSMSSETYVVISVDGEGVEAGKRVLELTGPLSLAGIPLFFISTYFSDYILVPSKARMQVVHALEERGFTFETASEAYVNPTIHHHRHLSSSSSVGSSIMPSIPPPTTLSELQARTFTLLDRGSVKPRIDPLHLIQCAGRPSSEQSSSIDEAVLQLGLTKSLVHQPEFLSLTLTATEAASVLLEKRLLPHFSDGSEYALLVSADNDLIPITLSLAEVPFEATGIVCGIAGRLVGAQNHTRPLEMAYLSTAKSGIVLVHEKDLDTALQALRLGEDGAIAP